MCAFFSYVISLQSKISYFKFVKKGNLCILKANVRHQQKAIFSIKKYLPLQSIWYLAILKTLNTHDGVIWTMSYPKNIIFLQKNTFLIASHFSAHYQRSDLLWMKINAIQYQTSINVIARLQRRSFFIVSLDWSCFWHVPDFYYKSTSKKECKSLYEAGQFCWITERGSFYYKVG